MLVDEETLDNVVALAAELRQIHWLQVQLLIGVIGGSFNKLKAFPVPMAFNLSQQYVIFDRRLAIVQNRGNSATIRRTAAKDQGR